MLWSRRPAARLVAVTSFLFLTLCLTAVSGAAVADYLGRPVVDVEVARGAAQTPDPALLEVIVTQVGMPLSMEQVRESILHLFSLGQFRDIQVDASEHNGGVALRYLVLPVRLVKAFEFRGTLGLSRRLLRNELRARYGELPALDRVPGAVRLLEALYRDRGYLNARVVVAPSDEPEDGRTTLVFEIDAGAQARVASLVVEGSPLLTPVRLFDRLGLRVGMVYDRLAVERRLTDYADALGERGYYEAVLDHAIDMAPGTPTVDLTLHVDPGPLVSVEFDGDRVPSQVRDELVPVAVEGSVDADLLEDSTRRLEAYLRAQGSGRLRPAIPTMKLIASCAWCFASTGAASTGSPNPRLSATTCSHGRKSWRCSVCRRATRSSSRRFRPAWWRLPRRIVEPGTRRFR